jgi:5-methylcytosine-specific restriction endonuclease McrA
MPIKPENRLRYPANWGELSERVKREAMWRCEECGVPHGDLGYRFPKRGGEWRSVEDRCSVAVNQCLLDLRGPTARLTRIVLTVHHLDGVPENSQRSNLVALCQRCHLRADLALRQTKEKAKCNDHD